MSVYYAHGERTSMLRVPSGVLSLSGMNSVVVLFFSTHASASCSEWYYRCAICRGLKRSFE